MHRYVRDLSCKPNILMSWSTSEIRVRMVPSNMFKPSSNVLTDWCFFCGSFLLFVFRVCLCHTVLSVPCSLVVTCKKMSDLLALWYKMCSCVFVIFQYGVLGQVCNLIASIPVFLSSSLLSSDFFKARRGPSAWAVIVFVLVQHHWLFRLDSQLVSYFLTFSSYLPVWFH